MRTTFSFVKNFAKLLLCLLNLPEQLKTLFVNIAKPKPRETAIPTTVLIVYGAVMWTIIPAIGQTLVAHLWNRSIWNWKKEFTILPIFAKLAEFMPDAKVRPKII